MSITSAPGAPMLLGHNHPAIKAAVIKAVEKGLSYGAPTEIEVLMAEKVRQIVPSMEQVRMVNSGTEATMSAIRLARGYTGRDKIVKFEGCYHGHADSLLVKAGSGALTLGQPNKPGRTGRFRQAHPDLRLQRSGLGTRSLHPVRQRDRLHHRRAGRWQHELHPACARLPGRAA